MNPPLEPRPLPSLRISGVVLNKPQLIEALRLYIPNLSDFQVLDEGERFYLALRFDAFPEEDARP
ncbi:MAG: hypothetical protein M1136_01820 [Chloroflexi bacterium]|nr:hypothetical protein [Chloroflexota bacterium]MCL5074377.1 hypothetical protein [Chloroflexota bacterium]